MRLALTWAAAPALACVPPLPGEAAPTRPSNAGMAAIIDRASTNIVEAQVVREADARSDWEDTVRVLTVYKGSLRRGQHLRMRRGIGFDPPPCFGMIGQMPLMKGMRGVVAFRHDRPEWNVVEDRWLRPWLAAHPPGVRR